jgi:glycosyltransferase involved in cell wall biosynthesis
LNEENFLGKTLGALKEAAQELQAGHDCDVQIIVVDNNSRDRTAEVARSCGATVISEPIRNIARARNTGARAAEGDVLFFLDADTLVPPSLLSMIHEVMADPLRDGGAVDVDHRASRSIIRLYLHAWRVLGQATGMAQGGAQFCRRDVFLALGGYDESQYMGEDVDFYWRLARNARQKHRTVRYITEVQVVPSPRRNNNWPVWKILFWTNPVLAAMFRRHKRIWRGWYEDAPR